MSEVLGGRWREFLEEELTAYAALLAEAVERGLVTRPIEHCPGWTARELTAHLIELHHWVAAAVAAADPSTPANRDAPELGADDALPMAFAVSAHRLLEALEQNPATPCWTFTRNRTVGFWQRRQPHEHAIHRWDLELALHGRAGLNEDLAVDGIDEVVTMFWPRQVKLGRAEPPAVAVTLRADTGEEWVIGDPRPEANMPEPVAVATGSVTDLALLVWGRVDPATLVWEGDEAAGREALARPLAP